MICSKCGSELTSGTKFCTSCGEPQNAPQSAPQPEVNYAQQSYAQPTYTQQPQASYAPPVAPVNGRPLVQLKSDRSLGLFILFNILTCGIYGMVQFETMTMDINIAASRQDGRKTISLFAASYLSVVTFGIYLFVWWHSLSNRVGLEAKRRGYSAEFSAKDFWLWYILGSLIIVGPFIYFNKLFKAMNSIAQDYNVRG